MKIFSTDKFLSVGSYQVPTVSNAVAIAIHPSSEVDAVNINGLRVGIGALFMYDGASGATLQTFRKPLPATFVVPADNNTAPGEKLVVQVYECGDTLVAPGARAPYEFAFGIKTMSAVPGAAACIARIPFSGRRQLSLFVQPTANDATILLRGVRYALGAGGSQAGVVFVESPLDTAPAGVLSANGDLVAIGREFIAGGGGDLQEGFDEIQIFAWQTAGASSCVFSGSAFGERLL